ncbi:MAG: hypothetical protein JWP73_1006 [Phenylobacterium sp.]|nr:hypothetical protein [Phenylobacterium sp.]
MILNPLRLYRRRQRLLREALEEAQYLRRRHGAEALRAAQEQLRRPDITRWGHKVLERAIMYLKTKV